VNSFVHENSKESAVGQHQAFKIPRRTVRTHHKVMSIALPVQPRISCVIPAYNEALNLQQVLLAVVQQLEALTDAFEVIVINDGSSDASKAVVESMLPSHPQLVLVDLSRNFGKEAAMTAGLAQAKGDVILQIDADGQHPLNLLPLMFAKWQAGIEVVYAVRNSRTDQNPVYAGLVAWFYRLINWGGRFEIPRNAGDFRLMDRKVVNALLSLPEANRFMKGLYAWVGFSSFAIGYDPLPRLQGQSNYGFLAGLNLALTGMFAFSTAPLRLLMGSGLLLSITAILYILWVVFEHFYWGMSVPGYATLIVSIVFFSGVQLLALGILSAYIARIYEEVKQRPLYLIRERSGQGLD
jgi:glycosyltransferase involved in cell wall biosynthesis